MSPHSRPSRSATRRSIWRRATLLLGSMGTPADEVDARALDQAHVAGAVKAVRLEVLGPLDLVQAGGQGVAAHLDLAGPAVGDLVGGGAAVALGRG